MIFPSVDRLADKVESRYTLAMLAAKRAKQLREGAPKLIDTTSTNPLTIALEEIAAGKITFRVPSSDEVLTRQEEPEMVLVTETEEVEAEAAQLVAEPVDEASRVAELLKVPGEEEPAEEPKQFDAAEIAALLVDQEPAPEMEAAAESEEEEAASTDEEEASPPEPTEDQAEQPTEE